MLRAGLVLGALLTLVACQKDETISGYSDRETVWRLDLLDGEAFGAQATAQFPQEGVVRGTGPCNGYSAQQLEPYPWFSVMGVVATKRACPDLPAEAAFFAALTEMTLAEATAEVLILTNDAGREMVFRASDGP